MKFKNIAEAIEREKNIEDELKRLRNKDTKSTEDHAQVPVLLEEFREVHAVRLDMEHDAALAEVQAAARSGARHAERARYGAGAARCASSTRRAG